MSSLYDILGVSATASADEIQTAYRRAAMRWHPDRNPDKNATSKFSDINMAYRILSNPEKRRAYDDHVSVEDLLKDEPLPEEILAAMAFQVAEVILKGMPKHIILEKIRENGFSLEVAEFVYGLAEKIIARKRSSAGDRKGDKGKKNNRSNVNDQKEEGKNNSNTPPPDFENRFVFSVVIAIIVFTALIFGANLNKKEKSIVQPSLASDYGGRIDKTRSQVKVAKNSIVESSRHALGSEDFTVLRYDDASGRGLAVYVDENRRYKDDIKNMFEFSKVKKIFLGEVNNKKLEFEFFEAWPVDAEESLKTCRACTPLSLAAVYSVEKSGRNVEIPLHALHYYGEWGRGFYMEKAHEPWVITLGENKRGVVVKYSKSWQGATYILGFIFSIDIGEKAIKVVLPGVLLHSNLERTPLCYNFVMDEKWPEEWPKECGGLRGFIHVDASSAMRYGYNDIIVDEFFMQGAYFISEERKIFRFNGDVYEHIK